MGGRHSSFFNRAPGTVVTGGIRHQIRWVNHTIRFNQVGCTCGWMQPPPATWEYTAIEAGRGHINSMSRVAREEQKAQMTAASQAKANARIEKSQARRAERAKAKAARAKPKATG